MVNLYSDINTIRLEQKTHVRGATQNSSGTIKINKKYFKNY